MFVDEATIDASAGKGGNGCLSFRREKFVPKGGPDGGDGGRGGDIIFTATCNESTLSDIGRQRHYRAGDGEGGKGSNQYGADGEDLEIRVPVGTLVKDAETGFVLKEFLEEASHVLLKGGRGGRGNARFATPTNQAPRKVEKGREGEQRKLTLELKLMADVGLIGFPNAGKSTFLSTVSRARPKIANYPFTTLEPYLGIVEFGRSERFVIADLPGLINGASEGKGLGHQFLRHVERTRVLLHMIDGMLSFEEIVSRYSAIRTELDEFSSLLSEKPETVVLSKADTINREELNTKAQNVSQEIQKQVLVMSAQAHFGIKEVISEIVKMLGRARQQAGEINGT